MFGFVIVSIIVTSQESQLLIQSVGSLWKQLDGSGSSDLQKKIIIPIAVLQLIAIS